MRINEWKQFLVLSITFVLIFLSCFAKESIAQEDINAPILNEITYPETVKAGDNLEIKVKATDDVSGIQLAYAAIESPSGEQEYSSSTRIVDKDGNYIIRFNVGQYAEQGKWRISTVSLRDNAQNGQYYFYDEDEFSHTFNVENANSDIKAPTLNEITYPETVSPGDNIEIKVKATDDVSGIQLAYAAIESPSGEQEYSSSTRIVDEDGNYIIRFNIGQHAEQGKWRISTVSLRDNAQNGQYYFYDENKFSHTFNVENANSDIKAPTLNEITYPETVSPGDNIEIKVKATDDVSGIQLAYAAIESPSGEQEYSSSTRIVDEDGNYIIRFNVGQYAEQGKWRISTVSLRDNAQNGQYYSYDEDEFSHSFNVISKTKSVKLSTTGSSPYKIGSELNLEAVSQGSSNTDYRFFVRDENRKLTNISQYSLNSNVAWVPQKSGNYTIIAHAKSSLSSLENDYYYYEAKDEMNIYIEKSDISRVSTTVDKKSPQKVGSTINLSSSTIGGENVKYRYYLRDQNDKLTLLKDYDEKNKFSWTPDKPGTYEIITHVKEENKEGDKYFYEERNVITYKIDAKPIPVSKVSTTVDAPSPQKVGKTIKISSNTVGGENVNFRFYVRDQADKLIVLKDYDEKNEVSWTPDKPGTYEIITHVKEQDKSGDKYFYEARNVITYKIDAVSMPISKANTTIDAPSPQKVGKTIKISSNTVGGVNVNYRFYLRDQDDKLTLLKDYDEKNEVSWTPDRAGRYEVITHVKEQDKPGDKYFYEARNEIIYDVGSVSI